jgi:quercetin dioxygenase-like cupin family protein
MDGNVSRHSRMVANSTDHVPLTRLVNEHAWLKRTLVMMGLAMISAASGIAPGMAQAQQPGTKRTDLQRHDLSVPGREVIQVRVDFDPGYVAPRHTHFGEEIIYVLEGTLEYTVEGRPPKTYEAGDVLMVPAGAIHSVKNIGSGNGAELATYFVEKGKPLITLTPVN